MSKIMKINLSKAKITTCRLKDSKFSLKNTTSSEAIAAEAAAGIALTDLTKRQEQ